MHLRHYSADFRPALNNSSGVGVIDVNGNNAKISNFTAADGSGIFWENSTLVFFHNLVISDFIFNKNIEISQNINLFSGDDETNTIFNCIVKGEVNLSGSLSKNTSPAIFAFNDYAVAFVGASSQLIVDWMNDFRNNNELFFGSDISFTDNTVKNDYYIEPTIGCMYLSSLVEGNVYQPKKIYGFVNSYNDVVSIDDKGPVYPEGLLFRRTITAVSSDSSLLDIHFNSDKAKGIVTMDYSIQTIALSSSNSKTTEQMQSEEFVSELNQQVGSEIFKYEPDNTPGLISKGLAVIYDGYVKQSEFDKFKSSINIHNEEDKRFVDIDLDLSQTIEYVSTEEQQRFFGKTYEVITNENVIEKLGGVEGIRKLVKLVSPASDPVFVSIPALIYVIPARVVFTNIFPYVLQAKGSNVMLSSIEELPDGCYVQLLFSSLSASLAMRIIISIENFNTDTMAATIEVKAKLDPITFT